MKEACHKDRVGMVVTIVDHGSGSKVASMYRGGFSHMIFQYACHASGTANSELLDYLGLSQTEKDMVISLLPYSRALELLKDMDYRHYMSMPGRGIAFLLSLASVSNFVCQELGEDEGAWKEGAINIMDKDIEYELILAIVNHGFTDKVMNAAKSKGASGGTVIEARHLGTEEASRFLGISIKEEKEIVAIVVRRDQRNEIMNAINQEAGIKTSGKGILLSLPVDALIGLGDKA